MANSKEKTEKILYRDGPARAYQDRMEDALLFVRNCSKDPGEDFFQSLAAYLARSLNADYVCISELQGDRIRATTAAAYYNGHFVDNTAWEIKDATFVQLDKDVFSIESNVQKLFPSDNRLKEMNAESCAVANLWSSSGNLTGFIAVISSRPFEDAQLIESVLKIVSNSAAAEFEKRLSKKMELLFFNILNYLNSSLPFKKAIQSVLSDIIKMTGIEAAGIRLKDGNDYPYYSSDGFPADFIQAENSLIARDNIGDVCRDENGNILLECTCGMIISGKYNPESPGFTPFGSLYTNDSFAIPLTPESDDPRVNPRNRCIHAGYRSVAIIPIRSGNEIIGLIHLADSHSGCFTREFISFFEGIGTSFALILMKKNTAQQVESYSRELDTIIDYLPGFAYKCAADDDFTIFFLSRGIYELTGYHKEDFTGDKKLSFSSIIEPGERKYVLDERRSKINKQLPYDIKYRIRTSEGKLIWVWERGSAFFYESKLQYLHGLVSDITEIKKMEETLSNSEEKYRMLVENSGEWVYILDKEKRVIYSSPSCKEITGYLPEKFINTPGLNESIILQEDMPAYREAHMKETDADHISIEYRIKKNDGQIRWINHICSPIFNKDGVFVGRQASNRDVTEIKNVIDTKLSSDELYKSSFNDTKAIKLVIDPENGSIIEANPAAVKFYGFSIDQLLKMKIYDINVMTASETKKKMNSAVENNRNYFLFTHRLASGEFRDVEVYSSLIRENNRKLLYSIVHDITERKITDDIIRSHLIILEHMSNKTIRELISVCLNEITRLTKSSIGFINLIAPDEQGILKQFWLDSISRKSYAYGTQFERQRDPVFIPSWVECLQIRRQVPRYYMKSSVSIKGKNIKNISLFSELVTPIFRDNKIVAVLGVGNKPVDYTDKDFIITYKFVSLIWEILETRIKEDEIKHNAEQLRSLMEATPEYITSINSKREIEFINRVPDGYIIKNVIGKDILLSIDPAHKEIFKSEIQHVFKTGEGGYVNSVSLFSGKSNPKWFENRLQPVLSGKKVKSVIVSSVDITDRIAMEEELQKSSLELMEAYDATLQGWSRALELREKETAGHSLGVVRLAVELARLMGLNNEDIIHIKRGALLHDIGKMGIPDSILLKPGPLSEDEWVIMRQHPVYSYNLLSPISYLKPAIVIPYCHHEKWDGTGYPRKLKGEEIPLPARLFAVVDVWQALSSDRPYRPAWSEESIITYLKNESGKSFDPEVVDGFLHLIEKRHP